jgi:protoporphyrin/coproporphyrin ferrochelatase
VKWIYVLIAHGTIGSLDELPEFLLEIRRGRPVPAELLNEMRHRYELIGHSPLLEHSGRQAAALAELSGRECRVAMRLSQPRFSTVISGLDSNTGICLIPMAPFSVSIYGDAARSELDKLPAAERPHLVCVEPWGVHSSLIDAYVHGIDAVLKAGPEANSGDLSRVGVILSAHSLPSWIISSGDRYAELFNATCELVRSRLNVDLSVCYQSQGADGGAWLGPNLFDTMHGCAQRGLKDIVVAPIGFLSEHIETLYDLDIEAQTQAKELGLNFHRVPTLGTAPGLIRALNDAAQAAISTWSTISIDTRVNI